MRLLSIASGSSGNCIYVGNEDTNILIDTGISGKRVEAGLNSIGLSGKDMDAVFITHEHIDHISGLAVFSRKWNVPIYASAGTTHGILGTRSVGVIDTELFEIFHKGEQVQVGTLMIDPIDIPHDAQEPTAYHVTDGKSRVAVATDLGCITKGLKEALKGVNALLLEANHDVNMLQVGPYPYYLKQRILGNKGHLSNENCGKFLAGLLHDDLKAVLLGHLSHENNLPELAYEAVRFEIEAAENGYKPSDFDIRVAKRSEPSGLIEV
ncbi:MAG: MBL fold metallo-hydrolase [Lachnospiraceae bacterium]|jgi:phosphoribosyl 1,2-cyclic phosphodiesterase|nr:MBL fold metallo-hydrolase [Lachnospiraceae bacterium]